MKALKTFLKKSLILLLVIALNHLNAVAMIVDNPTQNIWQQAKDAMDKSHFVQQVNHWADQIKKYQDMIEKAQSTINQLNKVNDILLKTNQFMNGSILNIPNPMGLVENATQIAKNVKSNALALQESAKNYNLAEKFLLRNIASKCPELDMNKINPKTKEIFFSDKGKEKSAARQALENLANALGNTQITTTQDITTSLSGRVLADFICKTKERELLEIKKQQYLAQAQTCLISKNFQCYGDFLSQSKQIDLKIFKEAQARTFKLFSSLQNRGASFTQELSVKNPIYAKEWIVLVDECHRTQSGKLHNAMKSLLPNAIFIAFSGTPLLKQDKKTSQEVFGDYIHCYKFDEAVSDKVVLDLNYEARSVDQYVSSPKKLDEYFELKTQNLNDAAKTELKKKWANLQKVFSTKNRLEHIVQDIVLDMAKLPRLSNGKGNAMLVAESVHNACRYFELFLETELKDKVAVITSYEPNIADLKDCGSNESEESYKYRAYCKMLQNFFNEKDEKKALNKTKEFEEEVKKRFINEPSKMKLLIVVDKLLTGFDAPSLTYLYIDKKMKDHELFQAVCRVNRLDGEDKDFGCIIDYSDLFDSLQEAHSDYTNGAFENYEREDIQGLISNKAQKIKKKLEEARDQLRSLCESVKEPKDETDYIAYFCGSDLEKNAQKRRLFYQLVGAFLRMFVELNNLEKPIYSKEEMQKIKQEAQFYRHLQRMIGLNSGDSVDLKSYSEDMHRILDAYIKATDSKTLIKIEDQGLCEVLAQMDINDFNKELSEVFKKESSMAESIANNTRKRIIEKEASDPKYYEKLSSLLNDLINQFREKKLTYLEYLQQIHNLAKQVIHKEDKNYPKKINTNALKTLYDNLDQNEALALEIDACIRDNKKDGWVGHNQKEKNLKIALRKTINDEGLLENAFNLAKHIKEYH